MRGFETGVVATLHKVLGHVLSCGAECHASTIDKLKSLRTEHLRTTLRVMTTSSFHGLGPWGNTLFASGGFI